MMMGIICIFCLFWISGSMCVFFKKKIDDVLPVLFCGLVLVLYVLAMFKRLCYIGIVLVIVSIFFLLRLLIRFQFRDTLTEMKKYLCTFGGGVFLVLVVMCIFFEYGRKVTLFDEFNFWATAIKTLWSYDGFASETEMWSAWEYPQGMPLIEWFGTYVTGNYNEWAFYVTRMIFDFSMVMPLFRNFNIKWRWIPVAAVLLFLFPSIANSTSYTVLSVDGDLAFLFGLYIYSILNRKELDIFYYLRIILCSSVIMLTKSFSIVFVAYGWLLVIILELYEKRTGPLCNVKFSNQCRKIMNGLIVIIPIIVLKSWTWYLKAGGKKSMRLTGSATGFLKSLIAGTWEWTGYEDNILKSFLISFFTQPASYILSRHDSAYNGFLTPFLLVVSIIFILIILERKGYINKELSCILTAYWIFIVVTYSIVFVVTHCTLLVGEIEKYSQLNCMAVSLGRYCAPVYLGGIIVATLCTFEVIGDIRSENLCKKRWLLIGCILVVLLGANYSAVSVSLWSMGQKDNDRLEELEIMENSIYEKFDWVECLQENEEKVFFLSQEYLDVYYIYRLVPIVIQEPSMYYPIYGVGDLQNYLYDQEFRYIYYADDSISDSIVQMCNEMLPEGEHLEIGGLYKIDMSGVKFRLERVNN